MRPEKTSVSSWRVTNAVQRQLSNLTIFRAVLFFGVVAGLALSFTFYPNSITTAQEQKSVPVSNLTSMAAESNGIEIQPNVISSTVAPMLDSPDGGSCTWVADTAYPIPIQDPAATTAGNNIYTFGGVSNSVNTASSFKFDGSAWTPIAPLPVAVIGPTAVSDGTVVYVLGGAATGGAIQTTLNRYDPATNTYTALAPFTTGTWNTAAVLLGGKIYKWGGTAAAGSTNVLEIYDIATNTWTTGAPYPISISFISPFTQGGFIYGAGGIASVGSAASAKTYRYDPATNTWDDAAIADLPGTRWAAFSSKVGYGTPSNWFLAGGVTNGTATISNEVLEWNSSTNAWTTGTFTLPQARYRGNSSILNGSFHAIGGGPPNFTGSNNNQKLTCLSNVVVVNAGAASITAESCGTPNGVPDPGETLSVTLPLTNTGDIPTTNLTATLQATGGVVASSTQNYGVLAPGGAAVTRTFTFTVDPATVCGSNITLTFVVNDGATSYPNITRTFATGVRTVLLSENFDGVTAPALPAGWTNVQVSGTTSNWVTTTTTPNSAPNAAFANDPATVNGTALVSPPVMISTATAQVAFKNRYNLENTFDGMVLEYTINGGTTWTDVITGGGSFASGGYNGTLSTNTTFLNPLVGRMAWTGNSTTYVDSVVNLPASLNGQTVQFRWFLGTDNAVAGTGVWVDDVQVLGARVCNANCSTNACQFQQKFDYDGDDKADVSVYRPGASGAWYMLNSGSASTSNAFGTTGDIITPADFDGDGKTDIGVFRSGTWYLLRSTAGFTGVGFGASGDIPQPADLDNDGKAELIVFRPSTGAWYTYNLVSGATTSLAFGQSGDKPVVGDYDGDCKGDLAVFRPSTGTWYIAKSSGGITGTTFGQAGDVTVPADYDGDGKTDLAVFRSGGWYVLGSTAGFSGTTFGFSSDLPVPADYDGDGKADLAVFRSGVWYIQRTTAGFTGVAFGAASDVPTPYAYVP